MTLKIPDSTSLDQNHWRVSVLKLPPNRVRRNYRGGLGLDLLEGKRSPQDGECPEDWLASLTTASNPGLPLIENEGLSTVEIGGESVMVRDLFATEPDFYLGSRHVESYGVETRFLTKVLDSAMRLHIQAHPTREFAQTVYNKPWGKFESYVILDVREGSDPYLYLGFQRPPSAEEWLRIVTEQDKAAMEACFDKIPVAVGEVWYVPGGLPHAIGEGLTVLEVMEPSDLVVRCEFEREGIVVPPPARFMGQEPVEALRIFDFAEWSAEAVRKQFCVAPEVLTSCEAFIESRLIGAEQIDCFEIRKWEVFDKWIYEKDELFCLLFVHQGSGILEVDEGVTEIRKGDRLFVASKCEALRLASSESADPLQLFVCLPGV